MKNLSVVSVIALALSWGSPVSAQQMFTGNGLLDFVAAAKRLDAGSTSPLDFQRSAYLGGFAGGIAGALDAVDPKVCLPADGNTGQYTRVLIQYLETNPAELHKSATILGIAAFRRAFPCR